MEKTVDKEAVVGLQPETTDGHGVRRGGPISMLSAALHYLTHPLVRGKPAVEVRSEIERTRRSDRGLGASRSPMDAGITGGFSLLMENPNARKRR
jgi:hypothetical protein